MGAVKIAESKRCRDHGSGGLSGWLVCSRCTFESELSTRIFFSVENVYGQWGWDGRSPLLRAGSERRSTEIRCRSVRKAPRRRRLSFGELVMEGVGAIKIYYFGVM